MLALTAWRLVGRAGDLRICACCCTPITFAVFALAAFTILITTDPTSAWALDVHRDGRRTVSTITGADGGTHRLRIRGGKHHYVSAEIVLYAPDAGRRHWRRDAMSAGGACTGGMALLYL